MAWQGMAYQYGLRGSVRRGIKERERRAWCIAHRYLRHLDVSRIHRMLLLQSPVPLRLGLVFHLRLKHNLWYNKHY
jgi:hypothetical protein